MSNKPFGFILGGDSITVFLDNNSYTINKQAPTYELVLTAVRKNDVQGLRNAVNIRTTIADSLNRKASGKVTIDGERMFYLDREITGLVASRVFEMLRVGLDVTPMVKFVENLMANPSKRAVDELFGFLDACRLPITADGHFLAYKRVRADYKDVHSGKFDNSVGQVLEMPRNLVDEDKNRTCSAGLHFCSYDYLSHFSGERIMILKINPADVVAIPSDYNNSKGRTCRYEVVDELPVDEYARLPTRTITEDYTSDYSAEDADSWDESDESAWESSDESAWESSDNVFDKPAKPAPVSNGVKLTPGDVKAIRKLLNKGETLASIGRKYDVSPRSVARIRDGEAWSQV